MPYKSEKAKIAGTKHDRRVKLSFEDKEEIRRNTSLLSKKELAEAYGVSRRLIHFILCPAAAEENYKRRLERGGSKLYYDKKKHTESIKEHRRRKQRLFIEGQISIKDEQL